MTAPLCTVLLVLYCTDDRKGSLHSFFCLFPSRREVYPVAVALLLFLIVLEVHHETPFVIQLSLPQAVQSYRCPLPS